MWAMTNNAAMNNLPFPIQFYLYIYLSIYQYICQSFFLGVYSESLDHNKANACSISLNNVGELLKFTVPVPPWVSTAWGVSVPTSSQFLHCLFSFNHLLGFYECHSLPTNNKTEHFFAYFSIRYALL
jgi:hypothetical protein